MMSTDYQECIEKIRSWRETRGGLPLFDDVDTVDKMMWGQPEWWEPWDLGWSQFDHQAIVERLLSDSVVFDPADPSERCLRISQVWKQRVWTWVEMSANTEQQRNETLRLLGIELLDERQPASITEPDLFRWECVAAAQFEHWHRVEELYFAWRRLGAQESIEAQRAIARIKAISGLIDANQVFPEMWLDYEATDPPRLEVATSALYFCALAVGGASSNRLVWDRPKELSGETVQRVHEASDHFGAVDRAGERLTPVEQALWSWCDAVIGSRTGSNERLRRATLGYESLREARVTGALQDQADLALPLTLTRLACWTADYPQALEHADWLATRSATDPWVWELLAQVRRRLGDEHGWVEAYNRFINLSPHLSEDWERNELLLLGLRHREGVQVADLVAAAPALKSDLDLTEAVLGLEWPTFPALVLEARQRWLTAVIHLSNPRIAAACGELKWAIAAELAGEAVASQLKSVIVAPLRAWFQSPNLLHVRGQIRGQEAVLLRGLETGALTMGQVVQLLEAAKNRSGSLGPLINDWLDRSGGAWGRILRESSVLAQLDRLTKVRNPAAHGRMSSIDERQALEVYRSARGFLTAFLEASQVS